MSKNIKLCPFASGVIGMPIPQPPIPSAGGPPIQMPPKIQPMPILSNCVGSACAFFESNLETEEEAMYDGKPPHYDGFCLIREGAKSLILGSIGDEDDSEGDSENDDKEE